MPVFSLLLFGIIDYSSVFRDYESLSYLVQVGGRVVAVEVNHPDSDYLTVRRVIASSMALPENSITRIVIWRATDDGSGLAWRAGPGSVVPPACMSASVGSSTHLCNVFSAAAGTLDPTTDDREVWADCLDPSNPTRFWCSIGRKSAAQGPNGPPDLVGVYIEILHPHSTGAFGTSMVMSQQSVFTLESTTLQ